MKNIKLIGLFLMLVLSRGVFAQTEKEIETALKAGKSIFLIVTEKAAKGTETLVQISEKASKSVKNMVVIKLERDDKSNAGLISKYRLSGAPLPIVLVVAGNGVVTGSFSDVNASPEDVLSYVPAKLQSDVLLGFEKGKAAFILCGKKNASDKTAIEAECKKAVESLGDKASWVFLDLDSKEESNFIALIEPELTKTTVLVFNGKGQFTKMLEASAKSADLVAALIPKKGGCCPGGTPGKAGCK